jgi:hypothetical protein
MSRLGLRLTQPPLQGILRVVSPGLKFYGCEANHSLSCSTEVKDGGVAPLLSHTASKPGA